MKKLLFLFLFPTLLLAQKKYTISGIVSDAKNGEPLIGVFVSAKDANQAVITDFNGNYNITLSSNKYSIIFNYAGYEEKIVEVDLTKSDFKLNVQLVVEATQLNVVEITAKKKDENIKSIEMSSVELDIKEIEKVPAFLGEVDIVRSIQSLPGVTTVGEGASGFNVRGGGIDQNLILLDEAPVYNSSHLFGFFSVFNPDAVKSVKLTKGGIPSEYGGRLSSILDVKLKEGNAEKFTGQGGIGSIFSRLTIEAPIVKNKSSLILAGRRSYIDVLAKPFLSGDLKDTKFYFYDFTAKFNYDINEKNKIYYSGYIGRDAFNAGFFFNWGNTTSTVRWKHIYNDKLFSDVSLIYSKYSYEIGVNENGNGGFKSVGNVINYSIKPEWTYYANEKNTVRFGVQSTVYQFQPGINRFNVADSDGNISTVDFSQRNRFGWENAIFVGNEQKLTDQITMQYGLRGSHYAFIGSGFRYDLGDRATPVDSRVVLNQQEFKDFQIIQNYFNLEPRFSIKIPVDSVSSIKASYNRMAQYIHLMSNTAAATPLDIYSPTTNNIKPQLADQFAVGYFRNFGKNLGIKTSVEVYYKFLQNQIGYIPTAELLFNDFYEADLLFGRGRAYGAEFFVRKNTGKLTGWISYTLSKTEIKIPTINNGEYYPQRFDRPHVFNFVLSYALTKRWELSSNFVYYTGVPVTFSTNRGEIQGLPFLQNPSNSFNNARVPDFHRWDISATLKGREVNKKGNKKWLTGDWVFSVYNVYNRQNAFTVYLRPGEQPAAIQYSIIGSIVPAVTYNFKF